MKNLNQILLTAILVLFAFVVTPTSVAWAVNQSDPNMSKDTTNNGSGDLAAGVQAEGCAQCFTAVNNNQTVTNGPCDPKLHDTLPPGCAKIQSTTTGTGAPQGATK